MHALLDAHFEGVSRAQFECDLAEKNWAILLENDAGRLRGFSTLQVHRASFRGEPITVVFSGDTIVDREAWGSRALPRTWIGSVNTLRERHGSGRTYWLLITSGFRTYRFLPVFWREFFPRFDAQTPSETGALMNALATERFGGRYDAARGIVRFENPQVLRGELREIPRGRLEDPHVAFFAQRNPGFVRGDELVCLAELSPSNLTPAGRRVVRASQRARLFDATPIAIA